MPIAIDSGDDSDAERSATLRSGGAARTYGLSSAPASRDITRPACSMANLPTDASFITPAHALYSLSPALPLRVVKKPRSTEASGVQCSRKGSLFEERLLSVETSYGQEFSNSLKYREDHVDEQPTPHRPRQRARTVNPYLKHTRSSLSISSYTDHEIDMSLADIPDFDLRQKTAHLMAVAPNLPAAHLYKLLVERFEGSFKPAKEHIIRQSHAARTPSPLPSRAATARCGTVPLDKSVYVQGDDGDETMIKIDLDDPVFMWDNDTLTSPLPEARRKKSQSRHKKAKSIPKSTTTYAESLSSSPLKSRKFTSTSTTSLKGQSTKANIATKMLGCAKKMSSSHNFVCNEQLEAISVGGIHRGIRETSHDREFIVPDDQVLEDSDGSYITSDDVSTSDVDMNDDDGTDLSIDMQPAYAYNSEILSSPA